MEQSLPQLNVSHIKNIQFFIVKLCGQQLFSLLKEMNELQIQKQTFILSSIYFYINTIKCFDQLIWKKMEQKFKYDKAFPKFKYQYTECSTSGFH